MNSPVAKALKGADVGELLSNIGSAAAGPAAAAGQEMQTADIIAEQAYNAAGAPTFYGINVIELNEFGTSQAFNNIFDTEAGSTNYGGHITNTFTSADDEIIVGIDRSRESLIRPVAIDSENGGEFNLIADDQYSIRQNKIGYFGSLEEGRIVLDDRALVGTIV